MGIRILIVDDHKLVRDGIHALLDMQPGMDVIATAENGFVALQLAEKLEPDIILMDISMPVMSGDEATRKIRTVQPDIKVLALSMHAERDIVQKVLQAGVSGYLLKNCPIEELCFAISEVVDGRTYFSREITSTVVRGYIETVSGKEQRRASVLTARETEVLKLLSEGLKTRDIAKQLSISVKTIESHRRQIMEKLNIPSIAGLTKYAIREGITLL